MSCGEKKAKQVVLARHRDRLEREIIKMHEIDRRFFWIRLAVLLAGALGFFIAFQSRQSIWLVLAGLTFLGIFTLPCVPQSAGKQAIHYSLADHTSR